MTKRRVVPALWRMGETPRTHDEPGRRAAGVLSQVISTATAPSRASTSGSAPSSEGSTPEDLSVWDSHADPAEQTAEPQAGLSELKEWTKRLEEVSRLTCTSVQCVGALQMIHERLQTLV